MDRYHPRPTPNRIDAGTAERLIKGQIQPADAPPGYGAVAATINAASTGPQPVELAGEREAIAQFTRVRGEETGETVCGSGRPIRRKTGAGVAIIAGGVLLVGGVAAAASGNLPDPMQHFVHRSVAHVGVSIPDGPPASPGGHEVKVKAKDPATQRRDKGASVCGTASGGRCPTTTVPGMTVTSPPTSPDGSPEVGPAAPPSSVPAVTPPAHEPPTTTVRAHPSPPTSVVSPTSTVPPAPPARPHPTRRSAPPAGGDPTAPTAGARR